MPLPINESGCVCVCDSLPADVAGGLSGAGTATSSQRRDCDVASESLFV